MDADNNRIERYRYAGSWQAAIRSPSDGGGGNIRIALSPDGTELLKTRRQHPRRGAIRRLSPLWPAPTRHRCSAWAPPPTSSRFGNDGRAVVSASSPSAGITLFRYDMLNQNFSGLSTQPDMANRSIVASADGDTLVLPTFQPLAPGFVRPVMTYDATAGALTEHAGVTTSGTGHASVSRDGSRMILVSFPLSASQTTTVYNFTGGAGGTLTVQGDFAGGLERIRHQPGRHYRLCLLRRRQLPTVRRYDLNTRIPADRNKRAQSPPRGRSSTR